MSYRDKRTQAFREQIHLDYSLQSLDKKIKDGIEYGDIVTEFFWDILVSCESFRIEWIEHVNPKRWNQKWNFEQISDLLSFDISWVDKYSDKEWSWEKISSNYNLKLDWIKKYPDKKWNFSYISSSMNFDIHWIEEYPDKSWDWETISWNYNFNITWVDKFPNKPWDWDTIVKRPNISVEWIKKYPNKNWDWEKIINSYMFDLSWLDWFPKEWTKQRALKIIEEKRMAELKNGFSKKKYVQHERIIFKKTKSQLEKDKFEENKLREYMAAYKIQQWWREITMSPYYAIGRKFINRHYDELFIDE